MGYNILGIVVKFWILTVVAVKLSSYDLKRSFSLWLQKKSPNKISSKGILLKASLHIPDWGHLKSLLQSFRTKRNFSFFIFTHLGCNFTPLTPLPPAPQLTPTVAHKYFNVSIYIHYKTHAQCSVWLWGHRAFIYSSYLFIFLSWGRDVGFYPSVLIAGYYRALRASLELARGEQNPREINLL